MKKGFTKEDFQKLNSQEKIEYLVRKREIVDNIKKSFPSFEIITIFLVLAYSRLHSLIALAAFGVTTETLNYVNTFAAGFNAIIVILTISFIARLIIYFQKHKQLKNLYEEFIDKIYIAKELNPIKKEISKKQR